MSWLQRIIDREPDNTILVPDDPQVMNRTDPQDESTLPLKKAVSFSPGPEPDNASFSEGCTGRGKSILIVEDEAVVANDIKETLAGFGYLVAGIAKSGEIALDMVEKYLPDLVLMDIHLATAMDGIETAGQIKILYDIPVIYLTAYADKSLLDRAKVTGPFGYVIKPYDERELLSTIEIAFYKHKHEQQIRQAYGELEERIAERTKELTRINQSLADSEERYRSLFEGVPVGLYRTTPLGQFLDVNPALVQLLGYPDREMLMGASVFDLYMDPGVRSSWMTRIENEKTVRNFEVKFHKYDGTIIWVRNTGNVVLDDSGKVLYYSGHIEDITESKRAGEELRAYQLEIEKQADELRRTQFDLEASRNRYIDLYEFAPLGYFTLNIKSRITDVNLTGSKILGLDHKDLVDRGLGEFIVPEDLEVWDRYFRDLQDLDGKQTCTIRFRRADGTDFPARLEGSRTTGSGGAVTIRIAFGDITEQKHAEEALQESRQILEAVLNTIPVRVFWKDRNLIYLGCNTAFARDAGFEKPDDIIGKDDFAMGWQEPAELYRHDDRAVIESGKPNLYIEEPLTNPSGERFDVLTSKIPLNNANGEIIGVLGIYLDITARKRIEEALRASEQRFRDVVEDQTEFICRFLPDGSLTFINEAYCTYFGLNREECIGKRHSVALPEEDLRHMKDHLAALTPENPVALITHRIIMPDGEVRWQHWSDRAIFDNNGNITEFQSVGRDITREKEIETQLTEYKDTLEHRVHERTSELSRTNLKLKKEIEDRKNIQKKLTLSSNEKDLLLREVHHRVKNNLQLIIGLVDMTKTRAHEPVVISTLTDIMAKVQTMGLVHTRLYESKRFDKINMREQIHDLVNMISGFYDHDHLDITTNIHGAEIYLPVDQAIPCALALNEIISNIHKHAFRGRRNGRVEILSSMNGDTIRFVIRDNGVGLPSGFDIEDSNRLGLKLMRTLVEKQLHGRVTLTSRNGTEVILEFDIVKGEVDDEPGTGS
ncbi:MAG: PAS domain S-box protein [Methanoregula sp.]